MRHLSDVSGCYHRLVDCPLISVSRTKIIARPTQPSSVLTADLRFAVLVWEHLVTMSTDSEHDPEQIHDVLAAEEFPLGQAVPELVEEPHDVLAAEEFPLGDGDPVLHDEPAHDVLAAEEFPLGDADPELEHEQQVHDHPDHDHHHHHGHDHD